MSKSVFVFDSDAGNPYSSELVSLLERWGLVCVASLSAGVAGDRNDHPLVETERGGLRSKLSDVRAVLVAARFRGPLIIVWARTWHKLLFLVCRRRSSPSLYLVHNPHPKRWPAPGARRTLERLFLRRVTRLVHSVELSEQLRAMTNLPSLIVKHPLYDGWVSKFVPASAERDVRDGSLRLLLFGRLAPDKFDQIRDLGAALGRLRVPVTLQLLVRPRLEVGHLPSNVAVDNLSRNAWIEDDELGRALAAADLVLAPYRMVTESGSIIMAISAGLPVVAFRGGALANWLTDDALVDVDDYPALAQAALDAAAGRIETHQLELQEMRERCRTSWMAALEAARRS